MRSAAGAHRYVLFGRPWRQITVRGRNTTVEIFRRGLEIRMKHLVGGARLCTFGALHFCLAARRLTVIILETERLQLLPAGPDHVRAMLSGAEVFSERFDMTLVEGYLAFPEALYPTLEALESDPDIAPWWMYMIVHKRDRAVVGTAGYKGRPRNYQVEIGYSVAPSYQNNGVATETVKALTFNAKTQKDVDLVIAHTLPESSASTRVLTKCNFAHTTDVDDPDDGLVWRWEHRSA